MAAPKNPKPPMQPIDWEIVEREYRAGVLSVRQIAEAAGADPRSVRRKAKQENWTRDLTDRVRSAAEALLSVEPESAESAPAPHPQRARAREDEIVERGAAKMVHIVQEHRQDLARLRAQKTRVLNMLDDRQTKDADLTAARIDDPKYEPLSIAETAAILEVIARIDARLIPLERQAFSIDAKVDPNAPPAGTDRRANVFVAPAKIPTPVETRPLTEEDVPGDDE